MTTGQNTAVTERTPETPSSARLTAGFPPPPVVAVERGRAAVRPACVASAATIPIPAASPGSRSNALADASASIPPAIGAIARPIAWST